MASNSVNEEEVVIVIEIKIDKKVLLVAFILALVIGYLFLERRSALQALSLLLGSPCEVRLKRYLAEAGGELGLMVCVKTSLTWMLYDELAVKLVDNTGRVLAFMNMKASTISNGCKAFILRVPDYAEPGRYRVIVVPRHERDFPLCEAELYVTRH